MENILKHYRDILGIDLTDTKHPIAQRINSIPSASQSEREVKKHHLRILGLSLLDIKDYDKSIYDYYIKRIVNNSDISIHGHLFELNQCAHFIRTSKEKNLKFSFGDPQLKEPDFIVEGFGIEITSSRFANFNDRSNPGTKLLNKFREKNGKEYADFNSCLLIDINQMSFHTLSSGREVSPTFEEVRETVRKESNFGLVMYFLEWIENINGNLNFKGTVYADFSSNCNTKLKSMMKKHFIKDKPNFGDQIMMSAN